MLLPVVNETPPLSFQCRFQPDIFSLVKVQEVASYSLVRDPNIHARIFVFFTSRCSLDSLPKKGKMDKRKVSYYI